jgi:hypothetical protein
MWNPYSVRRRSSRARQGKRFDGAITFDLTVASGSKFYWSFRRPFFHIVDVESILDEEEVLSSQARVTVRKGHNFLSHRWIAIKILPEFPKAFFLIVDVESILGEEEVWLRQARVTGRTGHNF